MRQLQQIAPISDMRKDHASVVEMLAKGPVVLTARGRPAGVFVSPDEWDRTAVHLAKLEGIIQAMDIADKDDETMDFEELCAELDLDLNQLITSATMTA